MCGNPGKYVLPVFQISEHRVAESRVAVTEISTGRSAFFRSGRGKIDEEARLANRQVSKKHLMKNREHCSRRTNTECQRSHRGDSDEWALPEGPYGQFQIHRMTQPRHARHCVR